MDEPLPAASSSEPLGSTLGAGPGEWLLFATSRVRDVYLRPAVFVDGDATVVQACQAMAGQGATSVLVRDGARVGLFTTTDLRDALLRSEPPDTLAVRAVSRFELLEVTPDTEIVEAMWTMVRHRVHRLLVREGERILGLVGQLDLVSFYANHSHILASQIDAAGSVDALAAVAGRIDAAVQVLHEAGVHVGRIARLVSELQARLFERLWRQVAPPALVAGSCLLVLGSEGRGEQILKTDQDNALVLADGLDPDARETVEAAQRFSAALRAFGYPPCPGGIMLSEGAWRRTVRGWQHEIERWIGGDGAEVDPEGPMRVAIFFDATAVAGDARLLAPLRELLLQRAASEEVFLARFAQAVDRFGDGPAWWTRFGPWRAGTVIDLKKQCLFPLVHGVRALALKHRVVPTGTAARLRALAAEGHLAPAEATALEQALRVAQSLRLSGQLRARQVGAAPDHRVRLADLDALDRDRLHDAVGAVRRLRHRLATEFRLGVV